MKRKILSSIALLLIISTVTISSGSGGSLPARAETSAANEAGTGETSSREEVIYAALAANGDIKQIYAVNILNISKEGRITDYGAYSSVKNLTSLEEIANNGDSVTFTAPAGRFYYQGNLSDNTLPWNLSIAYFLDNTELSADALAGKSGHLEIRITTRQNTAIDPSFFDNYLLQIAITLDTDKCSNITAAGATLANAGTDKLVTYTVMPGKEGNISLSADVKDFGMDGIQVSAIPFSMNIELPDTSGFTGELKLLSEAISQLGDGISGIKDGVSDFAAGSGSLKNGSLEFKTGLDEINKKSIDLVAASEKISGALSGISGMLKEAVPGNDLASLTQLPAGLTGLASGLDEIAGGLSELGTGFSDAYFALDAAIASIPEEEISQEDLQNLMLSNPGNEALNRLIDAYTAARTVKGTYRMVSSAFDAVNTSLGSLSDSITAISSSLSQIASQLTASFGKVDLSSSISQLTSGISELAENYKAFHAGLTDYTNGVAQLDSAYSGLDTGISGLSDGAGKLSAGMVELNNGAAELGTQTADLPGQIDSAIDDLMSGYDTSDFAPVSFVSEQNGKVNSVQFVLKTDKIEKAEAPEEAEADTKSGSFWTRLKALFTN